MERLQMIQRPLSRKEKMANQASLEPQRPKKQPNTKTGSKLAQAEPGLVAIERSSSSSIGCQAVNRTAESATCITSTVSATRRRSSIDGHALWDINDYDIKVDLSQPNVGYIRGGYTAFRTWYDGNGGFFPPHGGTSFPPAFDEMHIDRGEVWLEMGLRVPDWPEITIHWSHEIRDGQKDSTIWGDTTLTGIVVNPTRKLVPAYRDIDEKRDILAVDATKTFGNTDVGIGMRWDHYSIDNNLQLERDAGQLPPAVPPPGAQRFITQNDQNDVDDFTGHVMSETRSTTLWFTSAYSYTAIGSRSVRDPHRRRQLQSRIRHELSPATIE